MAKFTVKNVKIGRGTVKPAKVVSKGNATAFTKQKKFTLTTRAKTRVKATKMKNLRAPKGRGDMSRIGPKGSNTPKGFSSGGNI